VPDLDLDEALMRRFLLGNMTEEERDRIEERFIVDHESYEALCGIEDELILAHLRRELPEHMEEQFRMVILSSPVRRRRVDDMRALVAAAEAVANPWWQWSPSRVVLVGAAASAVLVLTVGLTVHRERPPESAASQAESALAQTGPRTPVTKATLFLMPDVRLAGEKPANVLRITSGIQEVELRMIVPADPGSRIIAELHRSDGAGVPIVGAPVTRVTPQGLNMTWVIPVSAVPPGQYDLTLNATTAARSSENVANRSIIVVK
jgi:hypothetical protein